MVSPIRVVDVKRRSDEGRLYTRLHIFVCSIAEFASERCVTYEVRLVLMIPFGSLAVD